MMHKSILVAVLALWAVAVSAQPMRSEIAQVLKTKKFSAFQRHAYANREGIQVSWPLLREVMPGYREALWIAEQLIPDARNPDIIHSYRYPVTLLLQDDQIIAYTFTERRFPEDVTQAPYYATVKRYRDKQALAQFETAFHRFYGVPLRDDDLYQTGIVYGDTCTMFKQVPEARTQVTEWVAAKNKDALLTWLTSACTEKQVYAVDGLHQLQRKRAVKLSPAEQHLVNYIRKKEGTVNACLGDSGPGQYEIAFVIEWMDARTGRKR